MTDRELTGFCLAPAAAPAVAALLLGALSQVAFVAIVSYVTAFTLGLPLFVRLRRAHSLAASSLFAAVASGSIAGVLLVTLTLLSVSVGKFIANPSGVVTFIGIGALWGAGFGLAAGLVLSALLRFGKRQAHAA